MSHTFNTLTTSQKLEIIYHYLQQYPNVRPVSQADTIVAAGYVLVSCVDAAVALTLGMELRDVEGIHSEIHPSRLSYRCYLKINL